MFCKKINNLHVKIFLFCLFFIFTILALTLNTKANEVRIFFKVSNCFVSNGKLVVKGSVVLQNNTSLPLFFNGKTLEENIDIIIVDNVIGKTYIANGARLKSLTKIGPQIEKTYGLKVMPHKTLESGFLTSFDCDSNWPSIKQIKCRIRIDNEYYYSDTEVLNLK